MRRLSRTLAALAVAGAAVPALAQQAPAVDPAAMAALDRMGAYLRTLKSFQVDVATTNEDVLDDGQKIQYTGRCRSSPGSRTASAEDANDRRQRMYLYDGKSFTLYGKRLNFYATIPAPPTIGQLAERARNQLRRHRSRSWTSSAGARPAGATSGSRRRWTSGRASSRATTCEQYAFRQDDIDWQIWIQKGDYPLPRRLVITTKTDEARPQFTAVYTWNLAPSFNDAAFTFDPPEGAGRVVIANGPRGPARQVGGPT